MFKSMIIYRIAESWQGDLQLLADALQKTVFEECGATQERSVGWVPPRGEKHGPLVESVAGQWVMRFMTEAKVLPASVLNRKVNEKAEHIEKTEGRKPGKKEKRELKDEAKLDLLPMAFTKQGSMWVWIDAQARTLVLDTSAQGRADEVVTLLVEGLPGFALALLDTQTSPQAAMAHWLMTQEPPAGFSADRETELKAADESKAVVRYARHPLDIDEVRQHIEHGKLPTKLAMTWDDRVSFVLTEGLQIKNITLLDAVMHGNSKDDGGFDTDVAIATGELSRLIPDLIEALGGEGRTALGDGLPASLQNAPAAEAPPARTVRAAPAPHCEAAGDGPDPIYAEAVELVRKDRKPSISYLQRKLLIGYNRAAALLERMQAEGLVSRMDASGKRTLWEPTT
ncbi:MULTISPECIES: recombination-associated protein RdgC [Comamonas]|uniref:recombination-associated protein RdgC n=1 Tax=Comamonas TaxID=283 RepID=UPI0001DA6D26|nr:MULTISPECIES: recombination-associated protein RdgC [Comamonas]EFI61305.1 recombination associated protein [Comamonas thiooxydans]TFF62637.1 recombination-associated protein RdgC [Comamonas sp. A23]